MLQSLSMAWCLMCDSILSSQIAKPLYNSAYTSEKAAKKMIESFEWMHVGHIMCRKWMISDLAKHNY